MRDRQTALLLLVLLTVLACTGYIGYIRTRPQDLERFAGRVDGAAAKPFHAIVIFRPEDCNARIDFMHAFARPRWQAAFSTAAFVIGGTPEARAAAQMLTARGLSMPVSAIEGEAHPGRFLGYSATPYLLVLDRDDRVRIVVTGPTSNAELRAFHRAAEGLLEPPVLPR